MHEARDDPDSTHSPTYAGRVFDRPVPKFQMPDDGMPADAAYQLVHDELNLDGNPVLNLASFVTSWMEPQADRLAVETLNKNLVDQDEYPLSEVIHRRVISMQARLFNAPRDALPIGTATIGSSEAIMLGVLAHKRSWQGRRRAAGLSVDRPNIVIGADVHTVWEKFANYFEVEARIAPMSDTRFTLGAEQVAERVDENTIAVGALLGTTFTGQMDDIAAINDLLAGLERERGWHIPIHIDAASGGFVTPFVEPGLRWDFRLSQVRSINVSNHKFGLVYPGMGSVIFRDQDDVPDELIYHITYLGGDMPNYSLNFSRPSNSVILQYYNFLRLGRSGYERIVANVMDTTAHLADALERTGLFARVGEAGHFPVLALRALDPGSLDVYTLSDRLRERGWIVPAYPLPRDAQALNVMRVVVKENFSRDMADLLVDDVKKAADKLTGHHEPRSHSRRPRPIC
ncbi:MAG: glutamate decarboxylase [Thermoleophilaceae bacterium]